MSTERAGRGTEQSFGFLIQDVARLLRRNFNRRVQELGLTQAQWQVLSCLSRNEGIRQSQLAELLELQPISVARLIDRMEAGGLLKRYPDPSDRRAFNLRLTGKAAPVLKKMQEYGLQVREQALEGLPETERQKMLQNLLIMRRNLAGDQSGKQS
jgi:DNA-binding MarR family transcriptional regulator